MITKAQARADSDRAARNVAFAVLDWMQTPSEMGLLEVHRLGRAFRRAEMIAATTDQPGGRHR